MLQTSGPMNMSAPIATAGPSQKFATGLLAKFIATYCEK
jgi:hypothetical protein